MTVTTLVKMDLSGQEEPAVVHAVQSDTATRAVELALYNGDELWPVPSGAQALARYSTSDGSEGIYDTLSDGSSPFTMLDTSICVVLAPQLLRSPGMAALHVTLYRQDQELTTFTLYIQVHALAGRAMSSPEDHINLTAWMRGSLQQLLGDAQLPQNTQTIPAYVRTEAEAVAEHMLSITGEATAAPAVMSLSAGSYTNLLSTAIDTDGSVYNGTGYKIPYRINSSGNAVEASAYNENVGVTGFIPCKSGDVIRMKNLIIDPADSDRGSYNVAVYTSSFAKIDVATWEYLGSTIQDETDENGYITTMTLEPTCPLGGANVAYIRLTAVGMSSDSVITVNQEITDTAGGNEGSGSGSDSGTAAVSGSRVPVHVAFVTDLHWSDGDEDRLRAAAQALSVISQQATLDAVVFGGDYVHNWSALAADAARQDLAACRRVFGELPGLWLRGNHDGNGYPGQRLSRAEVFNRTSRVQQTKPFYVSNPADPYGSYGYLDLENAQVRLVCINTADNDEMGIAAPANPTYTAPLLNCHNIGAVQLQWLADEALDLSGKDEPQQWGLVFLSHVPIFGESWTNSHSYTDDNGQTFTCNVSNLSQLVYAWQQKSSYTVTHNGSTVTKDFSAATPGRVLCFVNGHGHALKSLTNNGFLHITCPNACNNGEKVSDDGQTYSKTAAGTASETAFTVLTLDGANSKVYAWCYGAGYDRSFTC